MSTVILSGTGYGDFSKVPECSPAGLDMHNAFHTSCGRCSPTQCPRHEHFTTPLYYDAPSLLSVASDVLLSQQSILCREQGSDPSSCAAITEPTLPMASLPSTELEKLFPSTALAFEALDLDKLKVKFEIASYWGTADTWPFLAPPKEWELPAELMSGNNYKDDFTLIKFPKGAPSGPWGPKWAPSHLRALPERVQQNVGPRRTRSACPLSGWRVARWRQRGRRSRRGSGRAKSKRLRVEKEMFVRSKIL